MKHRKYLVGIVTIGAVVGWILGYYAGRMAPGIAWVGLLVLVCVVFAFAFLLKYLESRNIR